MSLVQQFFYDYLSPLKKKVLNLLDLCDYLALYIKQGKVQIEK